VHLGRAVFHPILLGTLESIEEANFVLIYFENSYAATKAGLMRELFPDLGKLPEGDHKGLGASQRFKGDI
jgi:hypothetical protein